MIENSNADDDVKVQALVARWRKVIDRERRYHELDNGARGYGG